jgi:hypothetical protein
LTALPIIAGPTLCFYAIEQGTAFAARAAQATLIGMVAVVAHSLTYVHSCRRYSWLPSLFIAWGAFAVVTAFFYVVQPNLFLSLVLAVASAVVAKRILPVRRDISGMSRHAGRDLLFRMAAALILVFALTSMADRLGPTLSGVLTPFPIATAIIAAFTQIEHGPDAVAAYFHGFVPAVSSFAVFCFVFASAVNRTGLLVAVVSALFVQLVIQTFNLWRMMHVKSS